MSYKGRLSKRHPYRAGPGRLATDEEKEAWMAEQFNDYRSRMDELFEFYGIERDNWMALAIKLAFVHVPGFQMEAAPRGAPDKWGVMGRAAIRVMIDDKIGEAAPGKLSVPMAAAWLAKREPWKSKLRGSRRPADALRKQYEKADLVYVKVWRRLVAYDLYQADPNKDIDAAIRAAGLDQPGS